MVACKLHLCGGVVPPARVKKYLHVSACSLFLLDCLAGLVLAVWLPHALIELAGHGSKIAAVLESASMFMEEHP